MNEGKIIKIYQVPADSPIIFVYEGQPDHVDLIDQFPTLECEESGEKSGQNGDGANSELDIFCENVENCFTLTEHLVSNDDLQENENKLIPTVTSSSENEFIKKLKKNYKKILDNYAINRLKQITTTTKKKYFCKYCRKSFETKNDLQSHVAIHKGEKTFKHKKHDKTLTARKQFISHKKINTGKTIFKCDYCHKRFIYKSLLTVHERMHTGEKPFKCDQCNKAFSISYNLMTHKRIHTGEKPYKCKYCNKAFHQSSDLSKHERIHTGEKPYQCHHCNKAFSSSSSLTVHKRIHTGEKPFICEYCYKSFSHSGTLTKHRKIHIREKLFIHDH